MNETSGNELNELSVETESTPEIILSTEIIAEDLDSEIGLDDLPL